MTPAPSTEFVPAQPGSWTVVDLAAASHEAQHAVAAVLFGVDVVEVRIDKPADLLGHCCTLKHEERWRNTAVAIAPVLLAGKAPLTPDPMVADPDAFRAVAYWWDSGRDHSEWPGFLGMVRDLLLLPSSRRAITAVAGALLEDGAIPGVEVRRLVADGVR